jgi:hypothetical protein
MSAEKPSQSAVVAAFEKMPFEDDSSILWKHVRARRFRFVYHYHPEIELMHFVEGDGVEFVGDPSQRFKAGHLVLLGSNEALPRERCQRLYFSEKGGVSRWGWVQNSLLRVDTTSKTFKYNNEYYLIKHLSPFLNLVQSV